MSASVQDLIAAANRKTASANRKVFAKKANDQQHHQNLVEAVERVFETYHANPLIKENVQFRADMRVLESAVTLSKKRLEQR